ncbi:MAG TPA: undecaprenyldiphospho-muramoylpentapeptide beta-N-acetylglucosaminyltransferase [Desulfatiglandales bacterium]|nr:undecaprenyldiphospho-muramoylpentapeptide beta-N-acetylglucosaminyltransferase [Desulfatiglandales bacterium]
MICDERNCGPRIIIAGGGTGGHLFPGIAIAQGLKEKFYDGHILFVVGRKKMEKDIILRAGFETESIDAEGMLGKGILRGMRALFKVIKSSIQSFVIIKGFKPHLVVGVGGYSSGPVCLVAWLLGIPMAIHEQNSIPGLTNRLLGPLAKMIFISFEESRKYFKKGKPFLTGNPIREKLSLQKPLPVNGNGRFVILIMGGSQGARAINRAAVSAINELKVEGLHPFVIHQTGKEDAEKVSDDYSDLGIDGEVKGFIEDVASAYARASLVICRAGATTIAELTALGKPSILIPYPHAVHGHQEINARALVSAGGADMILEKDLNGAALAEKIKKYMADREKLRRMSSIASKAGRPQAKEVIAEQLIRLMDKELAFNR